MLAACLPSPGDLREALVEEQPQVLEAVVLVARRRVDV
jgi:hypothetical protein